MPSDRAQNMRDPAAPAGDWLYSAGGGEAGYLATDPKDPNIFYGGDQAGIITRYDRRTGETRAINVYPMFFSGMPASALKRTVAVDLPDRLFTGRPEYSIHVVPASLENDDPGAAVGSDQPGPDAQRSENPWRFRRADHQRPERA